MQSQDTYRLADSFQHNRVIVRILLWTES